MEIEINSLHAADCNKKAALQRLRIIALVATFRIESTTLGL